MTQIKKSVLLVILLLIIPVAYGLSVSETKASNPGIKALTVQKTINTNPAQKAASISIKICEEGKTRCYTGSFQACEKNTWTTKKRCSSGESCDGVKGCVKKQATATTAVPKKNIREIKPAATTVRRTVPKPTLPESTSAVPQAENIDTCEETENGVSGTFNSRPYNYDATCQGNLLFTYNCGNEGRYLMEQENCGEVGCSNGKCNIDSCEKTANGVRGLFRGREYNYENVCQNSLYFTYTCGTEGRYLMEQQRCEYGCNNNGCFVDSCEETGNGVRGSFRGRSYSYSATCQGNLLFTYSCGNEGRYLMEQENCGEVGCSNGRCNTDTCEETVNSVRGIFRGRNYNYQNTCQNNIYFTYTCGNEGRYLMEQRSCNANETCNNARGCVIRGQAAAISAKPSAQDSQAREKQRNDVKARIAYLKNELEKIKKAESITASKAVSIKEIDKSLKELEEQMNTIGDDAQLANVDLQNTLQKSQQLIQALSNVSKAVSDATMAVVRRSALTSEEAAEQQTTVRDQGDRTTREKDQKEKRSNPISNSFLPVFQKEKKQDNGAASENKNQVTAKNIQLPVKTSSLFNAKAKATTITKTTTTTKITTTPKTTPTASNVRSAKAEKPKVKPNLNTVADKKATGIGKVWGWMRNIFAANRGNTVVSEEESEGSTGQETSPPQQPTPSQQPAHNEFPWCDDPDGTDVTTATTVTWQQSNWSRQESMQDTCTGYNLRKVYEATCSQYHRELLDCPEASICVNGACTPEDQVEDREAAERAAYRETGDERSQTEYWGNYCLDYRSMGTNAPGIVTYRTCGADYRCSNLTTLEESCTGNTAMHYRCDMQGALGHLISSEEDCGDATCVLEPWGASCKPRDASESESCTRTTDWQTNTVVTYKACTDCEQIEYRNRCLEGNRVAKVSCLRNRVVEVDENCSPGLACPLNLTEAAISDLGFTPQNCGNYMRYLS